MPRKTQFISVEVEIKTDCACEDFVQWFTEQGEFVQVLPGNTHLACIYFAPLPRSTVADTIRLLCEQIQALPELPRQQWDAAGIREFYIGYDVGEEPSCFSEHLSCEILSAANALGAGIGWALYPAEPTDENGLPDFDPDEPE